MPQLAEIEMQGAHHSDSRHRLGGLRLRHVSAESPADLRALGCAWRLEETVAMTIPRW